MNPVVLPQLVKGMNEAVVAAFLKQPGEHVKIGEPILEVETEKAIVSIDSPFTGVIGRYNCQEDDIVTVGSPLCWVREENSSVADDVSISRKPEEVILSFPTSKNIQTAVRTTVAMAAGAEMSVSKSVYGSAKVYPNVTEPTSIRSTRPIGFNPHVVTPISDEVVATHGVPYAIHSVDDSESSVINEALVTPRIGKTLPMSNTRRTIAKRMTLSAQTIPSSVLYRKADITDLVKMRLKINKFSKIKVSLNDYVTKATVMALAQMPEINSSFENEQIIQYADVNIGFAVDAKEALFVPVIHRAQDMDILDLSTLTKRLIEKAEQGKLSLEEMANPTFTISNTGIFGIEYTFPIITPPQSGILGVGAVIDEPVEKDGKWETHKKIGLSYAFDHRIIDGALGARFLQKVVEYLEEPLKMIWKE